MGAADDEDDVVLVDVIVEAVVGVGLLIGSRHADKRKYMRCSFDADALTNLLSLATAYKRHLPFVWARPKDWHWTLDRHLSAQAASETVP